MIDAILKDTTDKDIERVIAIGGGTVIDISKIIILKIVEYQQIFYEEN